MCVCTWYMSTLGGCVCVVCGCMVYECVLCLCTVYEYTSAYMSVCVWCVCVWYMSLSVCGVCVYGI